MSAARRVVTAHPAPIRNYAERLLDKSLTDKSKSDWGICAAGRMVVRKRDGRTAQIAAAHDVSSDTIERKAHVMKLYCFLKRRIRRRRITNILRSQSKKVSKYFDAQWRADIQELHDLRTHLHYSKWSKAAEAWYPVYDVDKQSWKPRKSLDFVLGVMRFAADTTISTIEVGAMLGDDSSLRQLRQLKNKAVGALVNNRLSRKDRVQVKKFIAMLEKRTR